MGIHIFSFSGASVMPKLAKMGKIAILAENPVFEINFADNSKILHCFLCVLKSRLYLKKMIRKLKNDWANEKSVKNCLRGDAARKSAAL